MKTKKIFIGSAMPGMKLAGDVYDPDGRLLVLQDSILTDDIIDQLKMYSVFSLRIQVPEEEKQVEKKEPQGYYEKLKATEDFVIFEEKFSESVDDLRKNLNDIVAKKIKVDTKFLLKGVKSIIAANQKGHNMFDMLNCMRGYDDLVYVHSMNVALICSVLGTWLNLSGQDADLLILGGLLHDIGKLRIPAKIITKPERLTDEEFKIIRSHPRLGYDILKYQDIDDRIKMGALMHHERYDGTGYPNKLQGNEIDEFAKIIAIADVYDAMTSNRVYRTGLCPFTVISHFERERSIYEPRYLVTFLEHIADTYVSNKVLLSNGEVGTIAMINRQELSKPLVMAGNQIYDLSQKKDITIEQIL